MAVFTPAPNPISIQTTDGCALELRHHPGRGVPVLLVHGASAGSDTFRIAETRTLVDYLLGEHFDVWTLDWRAGMRCAQAVYCANNRTSFTVDAAATFDVPAAIAAMRAHGIRDKVGLVAHCMGGAIVAQGIAQGAILARDVENVVITGLALFYRAALDDLLKVEDRVLEELLAKGQALLHPTKKWDSGMCQRDPGPGDWDRLLESPYGIWRDTPLRHKCRIEFCHRISYMFGMPYVPDSISSIHDGFLPTQFGYIPVQHLLHCSQNLRRGYAAPFVSGGSALRLRPDDVYLNRVAFQDRKLTLITGDVNTLWHRDSIDTMYEWLRRGRSSEQPRELSKFVLAGYGHQDLYWGTGAPVDVFRHIVGGLR